jgi:hypothetical protein
MIRGIALLRRNNKWLTAEGLKAAHSSKGSPSEAALPMA